MAPPLITEYKQGLILKRLIETFIGGPRLFSPVLYIVIQIIIFSLPALTVSLVNLFNSLSPEWKSFVTFSTTLSIDICLVIIVLLIKRSNNPTQVVPTVTVSTDNESISGSENGEKRGNGDGQFRSQRVNVSSSFLNQEDVVPNEGIHRASTWFFIAPNITFSVSYFLALVASSISLGLCTPLMISEVVSPWVRGLALFSFCNAHYTTVLRSPPEIAHFDPNSSEKRRLCYRTFYVALNGLSYFLYAQFHQDSDAMITSLFTWVLALFPLLWGTGILPPVDAFFPWALGTMGILMGGISPSFCYTGTLWSVLIVIICPILVFVISQEPLKIVLLECICGYIISCDTGRLIFLKSALCEDIPTKSFLRILLFPLLTVMTSLLCVLLSWMNISKDLVFPFALSLAIITMGISITTWIFRYFTMNHDLKHGFLIPIHILYATLPFLLHTWLTISTQHEKVEWTSVNAAADKESPYSLSRLVPYLLTIRAFSQAISEPRKSSVDFCLAFLLREYCYNESNSSFIIILFICSLVTSRVKRFSRHWKTFCSIWYAFCISTLLDRKKAKMIIISCILLPFSIWFLLIAVLVEGMTLIPLFTLPIFVLGFPRPTTFWPEKWCPKGRSEKKRDGKNNPETLDWKIYSEIGPLLTSSLSRKAHQTKFSLERGDTFLARYEDRLIFIRVISTGWNFAYLQIKGLEMQEQTSCHHQEAAKVDEIFEAVLSSDRSTCSKLSLDVLSLLNLSPMCTLKLPTYSESKSKISMLSTQEEKSVFRDMFYRAFSYLWIKNNPALKGETYQRGILKKNVPVACSTDSNTAEEKRVEFSVKNALAKAAKPTLDFFKRMDSFDGSRSDPSSKPSQGGGGGDSTEIFSHDEETDEDSSLPDNRRTPTSSDKRKKSVPLSRQSSISSTILSQPERRRFSVSSPTPARLVDVESDMMPSRRIVANGDTSNGPLSTVWVKQCVGDVIPSNAVKARVEKICGSVWETIIGMDDENDLDLSDFFLDDFPQKLKKLAVAPRQEMEQLTLKALRYACKLALDEIYGSADTSQAITIDTEMEEEIFTQLTLFEKDYQFCSPQEISYWIQQNCRHIVTLGKTDDKDTSLLRMNYKDTSLLRILNYEPDGVEFMVGQLDQFTVEGIWANLNIELFYLTSDDDERFSIQNDRVLLRNIMTQSAKPPLGYPVYDAVFRVNLHNFNATQIES